MIGLKRREVFIYPYGDLLLLVYFHHVLIKRKKSIHVNKLQKSYVNSQNNVYFE